MKSLRALVRLLQAAAHVLAGLWTIRTRFHRLDADACAAEVQRWSVRMLAIMGVALRVQGEVPGRGPLLQVANHLSWLDILVMNAARPSRFVSKADVQRWPVLGLLITGAGTLYIERESRRDAMRVVHRVAERLRAGDVISVFPEGTTGDGSELLTFHANLFQAAISAEAPVMPVALRFVHAETGAPHPAPVFVGDTTLLASIWATLRADGVCAVVRFGVAEDCLGRDRRTWAQGMRAEVQRLLDLG